MFTPIKLNSIYVVYLLIMTIYHIHQARLLAPFVAPSSFVAFFIKVVFIS